nr:MAG TPA: hypothetical protein [Caudoviricetes sp.]
MSRAHRYPKRGLLKPPRTSSALKLMFIPPFCMVLVVKISCGETLDCEKAFAVPTPAKIYLSNFIFLLTKYL